MTLQQQLKTAGYRPSPPISAPNARIRKSWSEPADPNDDILKCWLEETLSRTPRKVPRRREKPVSLKQKGGTFIATISGGNLCWRGLATESGEAASRARILSHGSRPVTNK
jgi:hypothetical protein